MLEAAGLAACLAVSLTVVLARRTLRMSMRNLSTRSHSKLLSSTTPSFSKAANHKTYTFGDEAANHETYTVSDKAANYKTCTVTSQPQDICTDSDNRAANCKTCTVSDKAANHKTPIQ